MKESKLERRVQFYPTNDLSCGYNLDRIESMTVPPFASVTINDAIEYYEIYRYFEIGVRLKGWTDEDYERYHQLSNQLMGLCHRYFHSLNDSNIVEQYQMVEWYYEKVFWDCFNKCKLYQIITEKAFDQLIHSPHVPPNTLFSYKKMVNQYGNELKNYLLESEFGIRLLIDEYHQKSGLYIPDCLTSRDISECLERYIDGSTPNLNDLEEIYHMSSKGQRFQISDKLRLKAKRRYDERVEQLRKNGVSFQYGIHVTLSGKQTEEVITDRQGNDVHYSYSKKWLDDTLDYPSILNNFIYIFAFADPNQMRWNHVSKESETGILERTLLLRHSTGYYLDGQCFRHKNEASILQINAYYNYLLEKGISLERVLRWFCTEYLQTEFQCPELRINMPSSELPDNQKCCIILTAFESILKQFSCYVREGEVDFELLDMSTTQLIFQDVPSMIERKYVYGTGNEFPSMCHHMFSDQSMLSHAQRLVDQGKNYGSFFEILQNETIHRDDYIEKNWNDLQFLQQKQLIDIKPDGTLSLNHSWRLAIIRDLYHCDVISRWHYPLEAQSVFDDMIQEGILKNEESLFSKPEIDYLNYLLNQREYCNGPDLRNRYMHGNQQVNQNQYEHHRNYLILLKLFVLVAIKINDEFCLREQIRAID